MYFVFIIIAHSCCIPEKPGEIRKRHILSRDIQNNKWSWGCHLRCKNKERWRSISLLTLVPAFTNNLWSPLLLGLFYIAQLLLAFMMFFFFSSFLSFKAIRLSQAEQDWMVHLCLSLIQYITLYVEWVTGRNVLDRYWWITRKHKSPPRARALYLQYVINRWNGGNIDISDILLTHGQVYVETVTSKQIPQLSPLSRERADQPTECAHSTATIEDGNKKCLSPLWEKELLKIVPN